MPRMIAAVVIAALALLFFVVPALASEPYRAVDTTMTIRDSGAIHVKVIQTVPDNKEGATDYDFELSKAYLPDYVFMYDYETGKPLKFDIKDSGSVVTYQVHFDRPYYDGYKFVIEYDNHNRIVYEGNGVYSLSFRGSVDTRTIERTYTVILPARNFSYQGYDASMDHPVSETDTGSGVQIVFHNVSDSGSTYAWEVRFAASGIDAEVHKTEVPDFKHPLPGMTFIAAVTALVIFAVIRKT